jgi:hypothetical protein
MRHALHPSPDAIEQEIAQAAAPWVLEHGLPYAQAKRKAREALGLPERTRLPGNAALEAALREHIDLYLADTQPQELTALRELALAWMTRLDKAAAPAAGPPQVFRPHLSGAVWNGLATQHSAICIQLFADDPKMVDVWLLNEHVESELAEANGAAGKPVPCWVTHSLCKGLGFEVPVLLMVHDHDDIKNAKRLSEAGEPLRGDLAALRALMQATA